MRILNYFPGVQLHCCVQLYHGWSISLWHMHICINTGLLYLFSLDKKGWLVQRSDPSRHPYSGDESTLLKEWWKVFLEETLRLLCTCTTGSNIKKDEDESIKLLTAQQSPPLINRVFHVLKGKASSVRQKELKTIQDTAAPESHIIKH